MLKVQELIDLLRERCDPDDFVGIETLEPIGTAVEVSRIPVFNVRRDVSDMRTRAIIVPTEQLTELL